MKKAKWGNVALWGGLALLVLVVIITGIILHFKQQELENLKNKNDIVTPDKNQETQENKIFLKNFEISIDKDTFF